MVPSSSLPINSMSTNSLMRAATRKYPFSHTLRTPDAPLPTRQYRFSLATQANHQTFLIPGGRWLLGVEKITAVDAPVRVCCWDLSKSSRNIPQRPVYIELNPIPNRLRIDCRHIIAQYNPKTEGATVLVHNVNSNDAFEW